MKLITKTVDCLNQWQKTDIQHVMNVGSNHLANRRVFDKRTYGKLTI